MTKAVVALAITLACPFLITPAVAAKQPRVVLDETVQVVFVETPLKEAISFLKALYKAEFEIADDVPEGLAVSYDRKASLKTALRTMLKPSKLAYEIRGDTIWIVKATKAHRALEQKVTIVCIDEPLKKALARLETMTMAEFALADGVNQDLPVNHKAEKMELESFLHEMLDRLSLSYEIRKGTIWIVGAKDDSDVPTKP